MTTRSFALQRAAFTLIWVFLAVAPVSGNEPERVQLRAFELDVASDAPSGSARLALDGGAEKRIRYWLVQYDRPGPDAARASVSRRGGEVLSYVRERTFLVRADARAARGLVSEPAIRWVGPWRPDYKLARGLVRAARAGDEVRATIWAFRGESAERMASAASDLGAEIVEVVDPDENAGPADGAPRLTVRVSGSDVSLLAWIEGVEWIEEAGASAASEAADSPCSEGIRRQYEDGLHPSGTPSPDDAFVPSASLVEATRQNLSGDTDEPCGFDPDRRAMVRDVRSASGLSTGGTQEHLIELAPGSGLEVTMAYEDAQVARGARPGLVNDLDLEVEGPEGLFLGNVLVDGVSVVGGAPDLRAHVERVRLPADALPAGVWTIRVRATHVPDGPQGYALHVTGDLEEIESSQPRAPGSGWRHLAQNEPNPFSGFTSIRFTLTRPNDVTLSVFDIAGRRVQTLQDGPLDAGDHSVSWDGRDLAAEPVVPGIYFYRLEGTDIDETRKLVVLR